MYTATKTVELFSTEYYANPYPSLAYFRENEPIANVIDPNGNPFWLISRYEDATTILKDTGFSKKPSGKGGFQDYLPIPKFVKPLLIPLLQPIFDRSFGPLMNNMLDLDDPDHARLRGLVHKVFTPRLIAKMQNRITEIVNQLLDAAEAKGEMEFINDFAFPLPIKVIAEILGVPVEDHAQFRVWSQSLIDAGANSNIVKLLGDIMALNNYLRELFKERRLRPQDDLITELVQVEEAGDMLNENELLAMAVILLTAGHETTVNLIGNGLLALLKNPEQLELLCSNPSLMKTTIEELLRYDSPVHLATERYAIEDYTIHGVTIPKGDKVLVGLGAANHDPEQFKNPDLLDICRENNRHLAFGQGIHYCVGAPLARMEGQIAFQILLERLPKLRLAIDAEKLEWRKNFIIRGLKAMPLKF